MSQPITITKHVTRRKTFSIRSFIAGAAIVAAVFSYYNAWYANCQAVEDHYKARVTRVTEMCKETCK